MKKVTAFLLGLIALASTSHGHDLQASPLQWDTLAPMPIGVQEIYPAVHQGRLVVAGGLSSELPAAQGHLSNALQIYDPAHNRWTLGPNLPEGRHHAQLVSLNASLYLIGGFVRCAQGDWCASRDLLRLDEGSLTWQRLGALPQALTESTAFVLRGQIHLVSGRSPRGEANAQWGDHHDVDWHWVYQAEQDQWQALPGGPEAKSSAAVFVVADQTYLVGGRRYNGANLRSVHRLDQASGRWLKQKPLAFAQAAHGVGAVGAKNEWLCSVGGEYAENGGGVLGQVQCRPAADEDWQVLTHMPEPRHGLGVLSLDGHLYVIGGARQPGLSQTSPRLDRISLSSPAARP